MGHDHPLEVLDEADEKDHIDDWRFDTEYAKYVAPDGDYLICIDHDGAVSGYLIELRTNDVEEVVLGRAITQTKDDARTIAETFVQNTDLYSNVAPIS